MAQSANGKRIALGGGYANDEVLLYNPSDNFKCLRRARFDERHCVGLALSADGKLLATLSSDQGNTSSTIVRLWDVDTGKKLLAWKAHNVWAHGAAFSPDGPTRATGGDDKLIHLWELPAPAKK
jgi:WD40 repeat protein